jgi:SEC-C motif-containing protein
MKPACPCGSGRALVDCCGPYLDGDAIPPSAEALMRSRYTAYTQVNTAYLLATWHATTRPAELDLAQTPPPKWLGLKVIRHVALDDSHALVEFVARYKINGRAERLHETSRFLREAGRWYYLDGEF